jgi:hypothetical protein
MFSELPTEADTVSDGRLDAMHYGHHTHPANNIHYVQKAKFN